MEIPQELKIGGHIYKVRCKEGTGSDMDVLGLCNSNENIITINAGAVQSQKEATLIHEILHAINGGLSEPIVHSLGEQLFQVLKDNDLLK